MFPAFFFWATVLTEYGNYDTDRNSSTRFFYHSTRVWIIIRKANYLMYK